MPRLADVRTWRLVVPFGLWLLGGARADAQQFSLDVHAPSQFNELAARVRSIEPQELARALAHAGLELPPRADITLVDANAPGAQRVPPWIVARAFGAETVIIYPARVGAYPYDSLESVVLHEIVHLSLHVRAGGRPLPRWFHEGVAVSVESGWGIGTQARLMLAAARDPGVDDVGSLFASGAGPETQTAYLLSAALIEDVRRRHGLTIPGAIAARVGGGEPFEAAFRAATGESPDEAASRAWRVYRGLRWLPVVTSPGALWSGILALAFVAFVARLYRRRTKRWDDEDDDTEQESRPIN